MLRKLLYIVTTMLVSFCILASCDAASTLGHSHSYGEWKTVRAATCTEEGQQERTCSCGEKESQTIGVDTDHADLVSKIRSANYELSYQELYAIYSAAVSHKSESNCDLDLTNLLESMLYGEWKDANDNYINYTYVYEDYNNTFGGAWYYTNLPTSRISGNTYYYYTEVKDDKLVIGYEDKLTEDRTDNFIIAFDEDRILVENLINGSDYKLMMSQGYDKVQKGNAKLAYIYIAKQIFDFKYPGSVKVTSCYVDYESKDVYATIQATNGFGGTNNTDYKLYERNGHYYIVEYDHSYSTNVDLTELNQKLQAYVSTGG